MSYNTSFLHSASSVANNAEKAGAASGEEKDQNEYVALMQKASKKKSSGQAKDPVEELLFSDSAQKSGGCVIC